MSRLLRVGPACYHVLHLFPPMVAHEMNFFYDEGLHDAEGEPTYELVPWGLAPFTFEKETLAQTMLERDMDVAMDVHPATVAYLYSRGHDLHIIAGWRNQQPTFVVGAAGLHSFTDLRGKRVGTIDYGDNLVLALSPWLLRSGVDPRREVVWTRGVVPERSPAALRAGEVDAAFVHEPELAELQHEGFNLIMDVQAHYPQGRPDRVIVATGQAIREKPEMVKAYIRGMIRAYWYMRKQPENFFYVWNLERRLRRQSPDPDERRRVNTPSCASPVHIEQMPFPYDGLATGLAQYCQEWVELGELEPSDAANLEKVVSLDLARDAFRDLASRPELKPDLERAKALSARLGY